MSYNFWLDNCLKNIEGIRKANPDCQVTHEVIDNKAVDKIFETFYEDYDEYCRGEAAGIICLGCKIGMLMEGVRICLEQGIGNFAMGHTRIQSGKPPNLTSIVKRKVRFLQEYNIEYINDHFEIESREEQMKVLAENGMKIGWNLGNSTMTHQPKCYLGIFCSFWLFGGSPPESEMTRYFDEKIDVMHKYLKSYAHLKNGIRGNPEKAAKIKADYTNITMHEFGAVPDKIFYWLLLPVWLIARLYFYLKIRSNKLIKKEPVLKPQSST
jgi:hypothetical protein